MNTHTYTTEQQRHLELWLYNVAHGTRGNEPAQSRMKLSELVDLYIEIAAVRPATEYAYRQAVRIFAKEVGNLDISKYTERDALTFREKIVDRATPTSFNTYRRHLAALFNFCVRREYIQKSPFADVKSIRVATKAPKAFNEDVAHRIIAYMEGLDVDEAPERLRPVWFWKALVLALLSTGIRRRQILTMRWSDIDFDRRIIMLAAEGSKTLREWEIPLPISLHKPLTDLREETVRACGLQINKHKVFDLSNFKIDKKVEMANRLRLALDEIGKNLGVPLSPHKFRHTVATLLVRKYRDITHAMKLLGHSDIRTTMGYVQEDMGSMRNMLDNLLISEPESVAK